MRIVRFTGGLGNQMFQFAFLKALEKSTGEEILIDRSAYDRMEMHNGFELKDVFKIDTEIADDRVLADFASYLRPNLFSKIFYKTLGGLSCVCKEKSSFMYEPRALKSHKRLFDGYWQSYRYFEGLGNEIKSCFEFRHGASGKNADLLRHMSEYSSCIAVHVRRGDYLGNPLYSGICTLDYYKKALGLVTNRIDPDKSLFIIFSNDALWCSENILPMLPSPHSVVVDWNVGNESYNDMRIMAACDIAIIANSSFSWWGAFLNKTEAPLVIAPSIWVNHPMDYKMQLPGWVLI